METQTPTTQADGAAGSGAPATIDLMERLQTSLETNALAAEVDLATRATPLQVAQRMRVLLKATEKMEREVKELRCARNQFEHDNEVQANWFVDIAEALGFERDAAFHCSDLVKKAAALTTGRAVESPPTLTMKVYDVGDLSALLTSAWLLEERGDRCSVSFDRDRDGHITGLALSVEDC